jgi:hypothetical protein
MEVTKRDLRKNRITKQSLQICIVILSGFPRNSSRTGSPKPPHGTAAFTLTGIGDEPLDVVRAESNCIVTNKPLQWLLGPEVE